MAGVVADRTMTPAHFARILTADLGIGTPAFPTEVERCIQEQLEALRTLGPIPTTADQRVYIKVRRPPTPRADKEALLTRAQLDITVDRTSLEDQFEWTLGACHHEPEMFATVLCTELGLPGEFRCVRCRARQSGPRPAPDVVCTFYTAHVLRTAFGSSCGNAGVCCVYRRSIQPLRTVCAPCPSRHAMGPVWCTLY
jgi:hypothetical protein